MGPSPRDRYASARHELRVAVLAAIAELRLETVEAARLLERCERFVLADYPTIDAAAKDTVNVRELTAVARDLAEHRDELAEQVVGSALHVRLLEGLAATRDVSYSAIWRILHFVPRRVAG